MASRKKTEINTVAIGPELAQALAARKDPTTPPIPDGYTELPLNDWRMATHFMVRGFNVKLSVQSKDAGRIIAIGDVAPADVWSHVDAASMKHLLVEDGHQCLLPLLADSIESEELNNGIND